MGFKNNCYCTCWADKLTKEVVGMSEKYAEVMVTISKKNAEGKYISDFTGRVRFIGKAFEKICNLSLKEKSRLNLLEVEVSSRYDKEKQKMYTNFICWDFEPVESVKAKPKQTEVVENSATESSSQVDEWADLPF